MNIVVTATSPEMDAPTDEHFGRAAYFIFVNTDTLEATPHANPAASAPGGAGTKASEFVAGKDVKAVVSGKFGPHAQQTLKAAGVSMYLFGSSSTVRDAVNRFKEGTLERL
jgi:predicted Fe-Mo cluster-binding NifX family protein